MLEEKQKTTTGQIFKGDFQHQTMKKTSAWKLFVKNLSLPIYTGLSILAVTFFIGLFFLLSTQTALQKVLFVPNPLSRIQNIGVLREKEHDFLNTTSLSKEGLKEESNDLRSFARNETVPSLPVLGLVQDLKKKQIDWHRALTGIDSVIKTVVSANDIVRKITIASISFDAKEKQIRLEGVRAYGSYFEEKSGAKEGTSISLAARIVQAFEESAFFKDLQFKDYSQKVDINSAGTSSETFTPLDVTMTYQDILEPNPKDRTANLDEELNSIKK